jgi:diaminohydroxyphosphoribosylaminopyrimidine deaminase/5-amino-6-(5-phosphoribosylamino)uracil reductase
MDSQLRLPLRSNLVRTADGDVLVFTRAKENSPKARALRRAGIEVVHLKTRGTHPDLSEAIAELGRRNILSVLLESGATLNAAAVAAGVVDKMRVFCAPKIAGPAKKSARGRSAHVPSAQELQNVTMQPFGPDFAIEGYLRDVYRNR